MQLIRCTAKLQKEMGLKKSDLVEDAPVFSYLGPWHANLIFIDRRKCVLFMNDKTYFNYIIPDVSKAAIRKLDDLFRIHLQCILADEGFPESVRDKISLEYSDVAFAKTSSKSVLGSMNELAFHYKIKIQREGGVHSHAVPSIISRLNRMPMSALGYGLPVDALMTLYEPECL